jgi:hypothetical protein
MTTRNAKSDQSLHPGLQGWRELRHRRCHRGTCGRNLSAKGIISLLQSGHYGRGEKVR